MGEIPSQISFSTLISHTFPGVFSAFGVFMIVYLMLSNFVKDAYLLKNVLDNWTLFLSAFGSLIFLGTIIGVIIDSIHHLIEEFALDKVINMINWDWANKRRKDRINEEEHLLKNENKGNKEFIWLYYLGFLSLDRFKHIHESYYCYEEFLFNLSISFFFSSFMYSTFLYYLGYGLIKSISLFIFLIITSIFCFYAGLVYYLNMKLNRVYFIKGALDYLTSNDETE